MWFLSHNIPKRNKLAAKISQKNPEYKLSYSLSCSCSLNMSSFWFMIKQRRTIEEIYIFSNNSHLEWRAGLSYTFLKGTHTGTITARFGVIWFSGFSFHMLINSSEATGPIWTKLWWNGPLMVPFQNCVRWFRLPNKMAAKLKIEKRVDEILIVHCCLSISQN
jgi:hypothetical protein